MIVKLRRFFEEYMVVDDESVEGNVEHRLQLACAALMIEVLHADHAVEESELDTLHKILQDSFKLNRAETDELVRLARQERTASTDYYQFTSLINQHYTQKQKRELVMRLWQIAYADSTVHKLEEHLVRRLADLLHVPHAAFMQGKHAAAAQPRGE